MKHEELVIYCLLVENIIGTLVFNMITMYKRITQNIQYISVKIIIKARSKHENLHFNLDVLLSQVIFRLCIFNCYCYLRTQYQMRVVTSVTNGHVYLF